MFDTVVNTPLETLGNFAVESKVERASYQNLEFEDIKIFQENADNGKFNTDKYSCY